MMNPSNLRLDGSESAFFKRQLESVDKRLYSLIYPDNLARTFVPTQPDVPDWANAYTWQMFEKFGKAKIIGSYADDLPRADVSGQESSKIIKTIGSSFGYSIQEIKRAVATGTPLDTMKGDAARMAVDNEIDEILSLGNSLHNLQGLLNQASTTTITLGTKAAGGKTWAVATPDEIAKDIKIAVSALMTALKMSGGMVFQKFDIIVPPEQYLDISTRRMGDGSSETVLSFLLRTNPFVASISHWHRCTGAGAGGADRMVVYPKNPMVIAGLVPMEFQTMPPEARGLEQVINCVASCGGVICRYPVAMGYGDGL